MKPFKKALWALSLVALWGGQALDTQGQTIIFLNRSKLRSPKVTQSRSRFDWSKGPRRNRYPMRSL